MNFLAPVGIGDMESSVAQIIADQLGQRTLYMIGASRLVGAKNSLMFKVGRNANKVTHLRITLDPSDTYTVEALAIRGISIVTKGKATDVYVDSLHRTIESLTGLRTRL